MAWGKLDDQLHDHPKIEALDDRGPLALWTRAMSWTSDKLTDGRLSVGWVRPRVTPAGLRKLLEVGLLHGPGATCTHPTCPASIEPVPVGHYQMHDYWQCNPTAANEIARRAVNAENGAKGAAARQANRQANRLANGQADRSANRLAKPDAPYPVPRIPSADFCTPPPPENIPAPGGGGGKSPDHKLAALIDLAAAVIFARSASNVEHPVVWQTSVKTRLQRERGTTWATALADNPDIDPAVLIAQETGTSTDDVRLTIHRIRNNRPGAA